MLYKLSPSEMTYLFEGCKFCFSLKVKHGISQPSMPMAGIFSAIAGKQKNFYDNKRTEEFCSELPPGIVAYGEQWVQSIPIKKDGSETSVYIKGRFDLVTKFDDDSYGVIDCKTASPSESKTLMYGRQLQAYTFALENAENQKLSLSPISKLGLLFFEPTGFEQETEGNQSFTGRLVWNEVKRDDAGFIDFIYSVIDILDSDEIYPEEGCPWCDYRMKMKEIDPEVSLSISNLPQPKMHLCPICSGSMVKRSGKFGEFWSCQRYPACKGTRNV